MSFSTFNKQFSPDKARFLSSLAVSIIVMSVVFVLTNSILNKSIKTAKEEYINRCSTTLDGYSNAVYFYLKNYKTSLESIYDENLLKTNNEAEIIRWVKQNRPLLHDDFKRLFYNEFKMTASKYVTKLRMNRAIELLFLQNSNITGISRLLGYENVYYFSKVFKDYFGMSPTAYKNQNEHM